MRHEILAPTVAFTIGRGSWFLVRVRNFSPQIKSALSKLDLIHWTFENRLLEINRTFLDLGRRLIAISLFKASDLDEYDSE